MEFNQKDDNTFEIIFKIGEKLKCKISPKKISYLTIVSYKNDILSYQIDDNEIKETTLEKFKDILIDLNCCL